MTAMQIRDIRQGFFWANNALIDNHLPAIGAYGLAVYMLLSRYANNETAQCEPSLRTIAEKLGMSLPTVTKTIKLLIEQKLVKKYDRAPKKRGERNRANLYELQPLVVNVVEQGSKAGLVGVVNQVAQNHTYIESNQTPDNSFGTNVPHELAEPSQAQASATPALNPAEREILRACNDGVVIAHLHNAEAALHLIELGLIELCKCGVKDVLCLKGKCPTHDDCPEDTKVNELQTALQQSFLPGSNANQPESVVTPSPQTPLPAHPAPAALPEVPEGYEAVYTGYHRHFIKLGKSKTICGNTRLHSFTIKQALERPEFPWDEKNIADYLAHVKDCPRCAKAAARAQTKGKGPKKVKPAIYSDDALFEAIAAFCFKVTEKADFKAIGGRVAKIRLALCDYVLEKLSREPTPEETAKVTERVKALPAWYDNACKKCDRPQSPDTFMTWYLRYLQSLNGTAQAEGDSIWFDGVKGAYLKREKGVLYEQDPMNGEKWIPAK